MKTLTTPPRPIPKHGVYNTGKVLVGLEYRPTPRYEVSADMEMIQSMLINKPRRSNTLSLIVYIALVIAAILIVASKK